MGQLRAPLRSLEGYCRTPQSGHPLAAARVPLLDWVAVRQLPVRNWSKQTLLIARAIARSVLPHSARPAPPASEGLVLEPLRSVIRASRNFSGGHLNFRTDFWNEPVSKRQMNDSLEFKLRRILQLRSTAAAHANKLIEH